MDDRNGQQEMRAASQQASANLSDASANHPRVPGLNLEHQRDGDRDLQAMTAFEITEKILAGIGCLTVGYWIGYFMAWCEYAINPYDQIPRTDKPRADR